MLVTFPFGLFVCAMLFDLADVLGGPAFLGEVGYWTSVAALVAAGLTTAAGMVDLWDATGSRTHRTKITFNLANTGMAALFLLTCLVRANSPQRGATGVMVAAELAALGVGAIGVWLGARLIREFEAGRADAATLDALGGVASPTVEIARPRA
ncbi:DUF2231 domain-containing protein [Micromonospora sp. DT233]|uniref:DUF2231 domain-containing protein n=1 Tax=Micromonospora sp. DT233 TaxID=3393432 RepID=UPI003CED9ACA